MRITCLVSILLLLGLSKTLAFTHPKISVLAAYTIDRDSKWQLVEAKQKNFKIFVENQKINLGYNRDDAVWCYFRFKNEDTHKEVAKWLCFDNYHIDSLSIFDGNQMVLMGDRTKGRGAFMSALTYELKLGPGEERILWVKIKKQTSFLEFSFRLTSFTELENQSSSKIALVAFFIGIAFLLLMINGILLLMTRKRLYAYYICYSLLTVCYVVITMNFAKHLLFPNLLLLSEARIFSGALWYVALSYFLCCFLDLKGHQFFKYRLINFLCIVNLFIVLLSATLLWIYPNADFRYLFISGYVLFMLLIIVLFWASVTHLRIERDQAIYALLAFAPQLVWGGTLILETFEFIPYALGGNWMVFASLYEVFLFGVVLSRNYVEVFFRNTELMKEVILEKENSLRTINHVQLRERRNIANIIHDNVGSKIAHIIHLFDMKNTKLAKQNISELASDIRDISHKILPKALDEGALVSSLRSQIAILNAGLDDAEIELFCYDFPERIEQKWVYDMYLIALEAISNALKHGKAHLVTIEFYKYTDSYHFQFTDDGCGFDVLQTSLGFGLDNMEKRVGYYHGHFEISSVENEGTVIQIVIPV
ncbi:sensor histidine kinase [Pedobacter montanisoli]|uniref:Histidine kinase domain-containing protein n=1 Tax=Pedobacter montanisoli TaxID=2923277 RepID=A0ABS9ZZD3_9SPHI|nr:7TM diverse intracellular signaling domain-containing protein [Pedobacter montanisoli]MCJ0743647.1 hypothetical protein [Pedobacter montanisoli]